MALSTTQYGYIIDPMVPFTDDKGNTIKDGFVRVFVAGSSTPVITYRNFDGAANQDRIELDNSGRTKTSVIGSKGFTYKVCVYDKHHSQEYPILTVDKVSVIGANITAGTGATVVTGLDGLTTKPDGFVDASVVGTDGYVALDHTLVTDDLNTDAKVTAVENDRYIPLLNEDVNDPDSKMTLGRLWKWVLGKIKSLPTTITAFRTGDVIPVDGPDGTAKMGKDSLLELTAQNALANNLVPAFVPNETNAKKDNAYVYGGTLYVAKENYNGAWDASKFSAISAEDYLIDRTGCQYDNVSFASYASDYKIGVDGNFANDSNYRVNRYPVTAGKIIKVITTDKFRFSTTEASSGMFGGVHESGTYIVPDGATYALVSTPINKTTQLGEGEKPTRLSDFELFAEYIGSRFKAVEIASKADGFKLDNSGSAVSDGDYRIDRYPVTAGKIIKVITTDKFRFSTTASVNGMFGATHEGGTCIVPDGATYVLVSTQNKSNTQCGLSDKPVSLSDFQQAVAFAGLQFDSIEFDSFLYDYKLDENGDGTPDTSYQIARYPVTAGKIIKVITADKFIFSTTIAISDMFGGVHESGTYIVPDGATYVIVSAPKGVASLCAVASDPTEVSDFSKSLDYAGCLYKQIYAKSFLDGYLINSLGYYVTDDDYRIDRYPVTAGKIIKVTTTDKFRFSSSEALTGMFGEVQVSGTYIVPDEATFVLVSTPKNKYTECSVRNFNIVPEDVLHIDNHWKGKKWYAYGTSITAPLNGRYFQALVQMSGMIGENKGIGGGGIGDLGGFSHGQVFAAVCNVDDGKTEADLITLETGANDADANVPLGTIYDATQDTLAGCLNLCIRYLQTNTNAQIAIMPSVAPTSEPNAANKYYEWQMMIRDICFINRVYFIDPACNLGYAKITRPDGTKYTKDTIHQTELGGRILAEAMWRQIKNIPLFRIA